MKSVAFALDYIAVFRRMKPFSCGFGVLLVEGRTHCAFYGQLSSSPLSCSSLFLPPAPRPSLPQ